MLGAAYAGSPDTQASLYLLNSKDVPTAVTPSKPPVNVFNEWPFKSYDAPKLSAFLKNMKNSAVAMDYFLVADEQTIKDTTLLLVEVSPAEPACIDTVRIAASEANAVPVAVDVGTLDMETIKSLRGKDNVYHGGKGR